MAYTPDEWIAMRAERAAAKREKERQAAEKELERLRYALIGLPPWKPSMDTRLMVEDLVEKQMRWARR
jgi:hypothetical protein